jgi:hypothetical protein
MKSTQKVKTKFACTCDGEVNQAAADSCPTEHMQVLLEKKIMRVKEHNERMRDVSQKKQEDTDCMCVEVTSKITLSLECAKERRVFHERVVVERARAKNQRIDEVCMKRKAMHTTKKNEIDKEMCTSLEAAEAKRKERMLSKVENCKNLSQRVLEAQRKKADSVAREKEAIARKSARKMAKAEERRLMALEERVATATTDLAKVKRAREKKQKMRSLDSSADEARAQRPLYDSTD